MGLSLKLDWFPTQGMRSLTVGLSPLARGLDVAHHLALPALTLATRYLALNVRLTRASLVEVSGMEYLQTARAKGLAERVVLLRHTLRNALIPLITVVGLTLPNLLGGAVITEQIFQWPGMGWLAVRAVNGRDYPLLMGVILVTATLVLLSNLLADILYARADPRIRYG